MRTIELDDTMTAGDSLELIRLTCKLAAFRAMGDLRSAEARRIVADLRTIRHRYALEG